MNISLVVLVSVRQKTSNANRSHEWLSAGCERNQQPSTLTRSRLHTADFTNGPTAST